MSKPYNCSQCDKRVIPYTPMNRTFPTIPYKYQTDPKTFCVAEVVTQMLTTGRSLPTRGDVHIQHKDRVCDDCYQGYHFARTMQSKWLANKDVNPRSWAKGDPGYVNEYTTQELIEYFKQHQDQDELGHVRLEWYIYDKPVCKKTTHIYAIVSPTYIFASASVASPRLVGQSLAAQMFESSYAGKLLNWFVGKGVGKNKCNTFTTTDTASSGDYICLSRGVDPQYKDRGYSGVSQVELSDLLKKIPVWTDGIITESAESIKFRAKIRKMHGYQKLWDDVA